MALGYGWRQIADLAGVNRNTVNRLLYPHAPNPPLRNIRPETASLILAVPLTPAYIDRTWMDATGTRRRIQAMCALGWTFSRQADRAGILRTNYPFIVQRGVLRRDTIATVLRVYGELWDSRPEPSGAVTVMLRRARAEGWFPPLAWDDDTIDNPDAVPCLLPAVEGSDPAADEWAIQHFIAGHDQQLDRTARVEIVRRQAASGSSLPEIAARLGRSVSFVRDARAEIAAGAAADLKETR